MDTTRIKAYAKGWNAAQLNRALDADAGLITAIGYRDALSRPAIQATAPATAAAYRTVAQ